jgi:hypothetical protein
MATKNTTSAANKRSASKTTSWVEGTLRPNINNFFNQVANTPKNILKNFTNIGTQYSTGIAGLGIGASVPANKKGTALTAVANIANAKINTNKLFFPTSGLGSSSKLSSAPESAPQPAIEEYTAAYKWNLPPHQWSLPFGPDQLQPDVVKPFADDVHSTRRGRIFYSQGFTGPSLTKDAGGNYVQDNLSDSYYGFQFMWNPDGFNQTTSVNMNITPSETDPLANLTGYFAANSHLDFTIRLDRTNDFACFKAVDLKYRAVTTANGVGAQKDVTDFIKFYQKGKPRLSDFDFSQNIESKIRNLLTYGTMADVEFLYRTINGGGFSSFGIETSNIGYLRPTIVRVDLGPQKFLGVIGSLYLNHIAFTKDMVPIRTDVTISIDLRALTSYSTNKSIGNSVPRSSGGGK